MTKYILHGGHKADTYEKMIPYYESIQSHLNDGDTLCIITLSASPKERRTKAQFIEGYLRQCTKKDISYTYGINAKEIANQIQEAAGIILAGGSTLMLMKHLELIPDIKNILSQKKVVAGSSAGAHCLSSYCYSRGEQCYFEGLGIVPVKVIAHAEDIAPEIISKAQEILPELPLHALNDYEFITL